MDPNNPTDKPTTDQPTGTGGDTTTQVPPVQPTGGPEPIVPGPTDDSGGGTPPKPPIQEQPAQEPAQTPPTTPLPTEEKKEGDDTAGSGPTSV